MQGTIRGILAGAVSGLATYFASIPALGYTNALAMPARVPSTTWDVVVVFGLGATLVALVVHFATLGLLRARPALALAAFFATTFLAMTVAGLLDTAAKTLAAWLFGAFLASLAYGKMRRVRASRPAAPRNPE